MSTRQRGEIINVLDYRSIKSTLDKIANDEEEDINENIQQAVSEVPEYPSREQIRIWLKKQDDEVADSISSLLSLNKKKSILRNIEQKVEYIEESESNSVPILASHLTLKDVAYYESHFKFADMTAGIYGMKSKEGIFGEIYTEAETAEQAKEIFISRVLEREDINNQYAEAADEIPTALIGDVDYNPRPRIVKFEDSNHLFIEFWSIKGKNTVYDVNEGNYITIDERARTSLRIHLDSGTIEYISTKDSSDHRKAVLDYVIEKFSLEREVRSDGGLMSFTTDGTSLFTDIEIDSSDVIDVKKNVGLVSTLDGFRGRNTNSRLTARDSGDVENDPMHRQLERGRDYRISHPQILLGEREDGEYELVDPIEIRDDFSFDEDMSVDDIVDEIREMTDYLSVRKFTVVLNTEKNTVRIWKESCSPSTRRLVFHLLADELGW